MNIYSLYIILTVLSLHYIADFIFQSHEEAVNKSSSRKYLLSHVYRYSMIVWIGLHIFIFLPLIFLDSTKYDPKIIGVLGWLLWCYLMFIYIYITHLVTDYITSRINAKLWKNGKIHEFFNCVGLDQLIHYATLFILLIPII